jgi:uncharacterized protein (DUF1499 family)
MSEINRTPKRTLSWLKWFVVVPALSALFCLLLLNSCSASRAAGITAQGTLADCPDSPNCVCSSDESHAIAPFTYEGSMADAQRRLLAALGQMPRTSVVTSSPTYIHATSTTLIMRYTDDLEFLIRDTPKIIDIRSLSRLGYSDLGTNRRRMEQLRALFMATP